MTAMHRLLAAMLASTMLLTACGGGDAADDTPEEATEAAAADDAETEEAPPAPEAPEAPTEPEGKDEPTIEASAAPTPDAPAAPTAEATQPAPPPEAPSAETMEQVMSFGDDMGAGGAATYESYVTITDDTGAIAVEVPAEWTDVDGRPYTDDQGRQLFDVRASSSLQEFAETWDTPGVVVTASREVAQSENETTLLDDVQPILSGVCTYLGREAYDDGLYTGAADLYDACGGTETGYVVLAAVPADRSFVVRVEVQVVEERDLDALAHALNSFIIIGDV